MNNCKNSHAKKVHFFLISGEKAYFVSSNYKAATNYYSVLSGDDAFCKSLCDSDSLCNGYSMDTSNNSCFLSNCDVFIDFPGCSTCYFASKKNPTSSISCSAPTLTESTTFQATTSGIQPTTEQNPTTLTMAVTTQNVITSSTFCFCICKNSNQTLKESVEERRKDLSVNKTQISSFIRKLTSAQDDRKMSEVIGIIAIIILVLFGLFLCCVDIFVIS